MRNELIIENISGYLIDSLLGLGKIVTRIMSMCLNNKYMTTEEDKNMTTEEVLQNSPQSFTLNYLQ